ncbi:MAG TPA: TlpA disulfide reductase family protein [Caldilineaceae bacterium]|nr:TlpA disulfide reductase family protein [Caldilineaceae bacterium]
MAELPLNESPLAEPLDLPAEENDYRPTRAVRIWQLIFVAIGLGFIVFLGLRLWQTNVSEHRATGEAPPFTFTTFAGETISLADLRGKGVVLNFWASWCDPCREEAALLEQTWRRERDNGIVFIGLDYLDQEPAAKAYLAEFDITYPNGPDLQSQAARRYGIKGVPETFFISPDGQIVQTVIGPIVDQAQMDAYLDKIRPE